MIVKTYPTVTELIMDTDGKMMISVAGQKGEPMSDREMYCRDCDRSIYGKYHDCDVNIENGGRYVMADDKCYCKIVDGKRAEKYPWEKNGKEER